MNQERRQYYRINGDISLDYEIISETELSQGKFPSQFQVSPYFNLLGQLQELDNDSSYQIRRIAQKEPAIAGFLEMINAKINAIAKTVAAGDMEFSNLSTQNINLSEGGMSFFAKEAIPEACYLAMKLVFIESFSGLLVYGRVLHCVPQEDGSFKIGIEFTDMPESSRTIVARHILSSQAREIQLDDDEE